MTEELKTYTAFRDGTAVAKGNQGAVLALLKNDEFGAQAIIFEDWSGKEIDFDLNDLDIPTKPVGPGRPKMGVKPREVTLLPRHWEWLDSQSGGASAGIRNLVDAAIKASDGRMTPRQSLDASYRFMSSVAGNYPNFEEASRFLSRRDRSGFVEMMQDWPQDVREYALMLAEAALAESQ